jgi:hypothetical protein
LPGSAGTGKTTVARLLAPEESVAPNRRSLRRFRHIPEVRTFGSVSDVAPYYRKADAAIVPLRAGGGTRIKVLEAFSFGVPVVATPIGVEGLRVENEKQVLIADNPADFAEQCCRLVEDRPLCEGLAAAARACLMEKYTPEILRATLRRVIAPLTGDLERVITIAYRGIAMPPDAKVLVLTPVKDAEPFLEIYFDGLYRLTYPREFLSFGFLESDSADNTYQEIERRVAALSQKFRAASLWKKDFGFHIPKRMPRWDKRIQLERRSVLASVAETAGASKPKNSIARSSACPRRSAMRIEDRRTPAPRKMP